MPSWAMSSASFNSRACAPRANVFTPRWSPVLPPWRATGVFLAHLRRVRHRSVADSCHVDCVVRRPVPPRAGQTRAKVVHPAHPLPLDRARAFRSELYYLRFSWLNVGYAFAGSSVIPGEVLGMYGVGFVIAAWSGLLLAFPARQVLLWTGGARRHLVGRALAPPAHGKSDSANSQSPPGRSAVGVSGRGRTDPSLGPGGVRGSASGCESPGRAPAHPRGPRRAPRVRSTANRRLRSRIGVARAKSF